jgi:hypothetical protein
LACSHLQANQLEQAACSLPPAALLLEVCVVAHLPVKIGEPSLLGEHRLLQSAALCAADDVRVRT